MGIHDEKMKCILSVDIYNIQTYVLLWEMCVMLYTVKTKVFGTIANYVYIVSATLCFMEKHYSQ